MTVWRGKLSDWLQTFTTLPDEDKPRPVWVLFVYFFNIGLHASVQYSMAKPRPPKTMWRMWQRTHKHQRHGNRFVKSQLNLKKETEETWTDVCCFFNLVVLDVTDLEKVFIRILVVLICWLCMSLHALTVNGCESRLLAWPAQQLDLKPPTLCRSVSKRGSRVGPQPLPAAFVRELGFNF